MNLTFEIKRRKGKYTEIPRPEPSLFSSKLLFISYKWIFQIVDFQRQIPLVFPSVIQLKVIWMCLSKT